MSVPNSGPAAPPPPVWDAHPAGSAQVAYGGFWIRLLAYIIDAILLSIAMGIVGGIAGLNFYDPSIETYNPKNRSCRCSGTLICSVVRPLVASRGRDKSRRRA